LKDVNSYLIINDSDIISNMIKTCSNIKNLGYEDAVNVILRKKRFKAILIPNNILEKDLVKFKEINKLRDFEMEWQIDEDKKEKLSFPILKKSSICKSIDCSFLLSRNIYPQNNWAFVSPEYEVIVSKFLKI